MLWEEISLFSVRTIFFSLCYRKEFIIRWVMARFILRKIRWSVPKLLNQTQLHSVNSTCTEAVSLTQNLSVATLMAQHRKTAGNVGGFDKKRLSLCLRNQLGFLFLCWLDSTSFIDLSRNDSDTKLCLLSLLLFLHVLSPFLTGSPDGDLTKISVRMYRHFCIIIIFLC